MARDRATLSDLSHHPDAVLGGVDERDVLITRRNKENVLVSTVTRDTAVRSTISTLATLLQHLPEDESGWRVATAMHSTFPWMVSLPSAEQASFVSRYTSLLRTCIVHDDYQPLAVLLRQWEYTASVLQDEDALALFLAPIEEDEGTGVPVDVPQPRAPSRRGRGDAVHERPSTPTHEMESSPGFVQELESAALAVDDVAEAAAVEVLDKHAGPGVDIYVALKEGRRALSAQLKRIVERKVATAVITAAGRTVQPMNIWVVSEMPKMRSGVIQREVITAISNHLELGEMRDLSNPEATEEIRRHVQHRKQDRSRRAAASRRRTRQKEAL